MLTIPPLLAYSIRGEPIRGEPIRGEPIRGEPIRGERKVVYALISPETRYCVMKT